MSKTKKTIAVQFRQRGCGSANEGLPKAVRDILEGLGLDASNVQVVKVA